DGDPQIMARDYCVTVFVEIELLGFVEFWIAHGRKYPTMDVPEDSPDIPLKMWLVRAGTLSRAYTLPRKTTINRFNKVTVSGMGTKGDWVSTKMTRLPIMNI